VQIPEISYRLGAGEKWLRSVQVGESPLQPFPRGATKRRIVKKVGEKPPFTHILEPGMVPRVAGRPDAPCGPRAPVQSLWGAGLGVPLRSPGLPWVVSTIRPIPERLAAWPLALP
jgi:hypothetical protein